MVRQNVPDELVRRRRIALAGHRGDEETARQALADPDARIRATALGALGRMNGLTSADLSAALEDPDSAVRRRACDLSPGTGDEIVPAVIAALRDVDALVVEAACAALGERGGQAGTAVSALVHVVRDHRDALCREAAVAALGAIGDPAGLPAIVTATSDKPAVRRRAVLALAPFSGPEVDAALRRARSDRDWQVRQAAEDLSTE